MTEAPKNFWRVQAVFYKKPIGFKITSREMVDRGIHRVDVTNYAREMACVDKEEAGFGVGMGSRPIVYTLNSPPDSKLCDTGECLASHHCVLKLIAKGPENKRLLELLE